MRKKFLNFATIKHRLYYRFKLIVNCISGLSIFKNFPHISYIAQIKKIPYLQLPQFKFQRFIKAYDENINADSLLAKQKNVQKRFEIFKTLADEMDIIKNQSVEQTKNQLKLNEILDYAAVMIEGGTIADLEELNKNRRSNANSSDIKTGEKHQEGSIWAQFAPKKSPEHNEEKENEEMQIENDAEIVHKDTFHKNSSLYIAEFPDTLTKSDLETFGSNYKGFKRVYVHKINHARSLKCRAWIIFNDYVQISNICADFNKHVFKDGSKLVANVSREIQYRIRPVTGLTNHSDILLSDLKNAINLVLMFDEMWGLFGSNPGKMNKNPDLNKISIDSGNPLLAGLSKYIVKEEDYVETLDDNMDIQQDASLAQPKQAENSDFATKAKIQFSTNDEYKAALDPLILYLRIVHSFDFYHGSKFENESEMENVLGVLHARGDMIREELFQSDINEYQLNFSSRIQRYLTHHKELTQDDLDFISFKDIELCVDEFIKKNSLKINDTKWQCLVCNKKFRDNNFLSKHIGNKHNTELDVMKYETKLFNNLLKDSRSISQIVHNFNRVSRKSAAEQLASEMVNSNALAAVNGYPFVNGNASSTPVQFESSEKPLANQNNPTSNANSADLISSAVSQLSSNPMLMATLINQSIMSKNNGIGFANSMGGSSGRFNHKFNDRRAVVNYQDMDTPN